MIILYIYDNTLYLTLCFFNNIFYYILTKHLTKEIQNPSGRLGTQLAFSVCSSIFFFFPEQLCNSNCRIRREVKGDEDCGGRMYAWGPR